MKDAHFTVYLARDAARTPVLLEAVLAICRRASGVDEKGSDWLIRDSWRAAKDPQNESRKLLEFGVFGFGFL